MRWEGGGSMCSSEALPCRHHWDNADRRLAPAEIAAKTD